jgi:hypothetical protein
MSRHFLTRLRKLVDRDRPPRQKILIPKNIVRDAELWEKLLLRVSSGISMNRLTIRQPTRLAISDSCPFGIGGFLLSGRAWRIKIPKPSPIYGHSTINNFLEFLEMVINVWIMCIEHVESSECLLAVGDNTSAMGWMFRSSRLHEDCSIYYDAVQITARHIAKIIIASKHCLATQHTKGKENIVAPTSFR